MNRPPYAKLATHNNHKLSYRVIFWTEPKVYEKFPVIFPSKGAQTLETCCTRWDILFAVLNAKKAHKTTTNGPLH